MSVAEDAIDAVEVTIEERGVGDDVALGHDRIVGLHVLTPTDVADEPMVIEDDALAADLGEAVPSGVGEPGLIEFGGFRVGNDGAVSLIGVETRRVEPRRLIIVEGILALSDRDLRARMDLRVFVEAAEGIRFQRRLKRDQKERGRSEDSVFDQYHESVKPMHVKFVDPSKQYADLVVSGEQSVDSAVDAVMTRLREAMATNATRDMSSICSSPYFYSAIDYTLQYLAPGYITW